MSGRDYEKRIRNKGLKKVWVAKKMGISRVTLDNKLNEKVEFTKAEKYLLDAILRGKDVDIE